MTRSFLILPLIFAITVAVYSNGLNGPFLFDDHIHITQNQWVKIDRLDWASLIRAWNSSFSAFPANRPLSQLSFGVNHAVSGLDPWAFKLTNLVIHLATGWLVFVFTRLSYRALMGDSGDPDTGRMLAAATTALWLLHPLHVSTVLYTVQRMAQLSSLSLLAALTCYFYGRLRIAAGRTGLGWMLAAAPIALIGFLAKENTVLLPLLLLVSELTLLRSVSLGQQRSVVHSVWLVYIALPLLAGLAYLLTHPGMLAYEGRPFTLAERLLTQPRVLWLYVKWLFIPDISEFGLFHDDLPNSTGLMSPPGTLVAILGLVVTGAAAAIYRRKAPMFAFAVLFFLANHVLESTVLPLEMVFEHRNYLAALGPLMLLAYLVVVGSQRLKVRALAVALGALLLTSYGAVTYMRVNNWASYQSFILTAADNHPKSPRSNFMAAQFLIAALDKSGGDASALADAAREFLHKGLAADARCINCLFGLLVLDLHLGHPPDPALLKRLRETLADGAVGPGKVSVSQFSYLVKWHESDGYQLAPGDIKAIFDAALTNPGWNNTGRAGIEAAYREYYEAVAGDPAAALPHARAAVAAWPQQWSYHMQLVRLLRKLGMSEEALVAAQRASGVAGNTAQQQETALVLAALSKQSQH